MMNGGGTDSGRIDGAESEREDQSDQQTANKRSAHGGTPLTNRNGASVTVAAFLLRSFPRQRTWRRPQWNRPAYRRFVAIEEAQDWSPVQNWYRPLCSDKLAGKDRQRPLRRRTG